MWSFAKHFGIFLVHKDTPGALEGRIDIEPVIEIMRWNCTDA